MKKILMLLIIVLMGCGGSGADAADAEVTHPIEVVVTEESNCPDYVISGQSNATRDWSYLEDLLGAKIQNIAVSGYSIKQLIADLPNKEICKDNLKGILFIHGEHDALWGTNPYSYVRQVEQYRMMIADVKMYISLVGYTTNTEQDYLFDGIRKAQLESGYSVSFEDAYKFRDQGQLSDHIHFKSRAALLIANAFAEDIWND